MIAEWSVTVSNVAGSSGDRPIAIQMSVDGGDPEAIAFISGLGTGESQTYVFDRELRPGRHPVVITVGDAMREMTIDVPAGNGLVAMLTPTPQTVPVPKRDPASTPQIVPVPKRAPTASPAPQIVPIRPTPEPTPFPRPSNALETPSPTSTATPMPTPTALPTATPLTTGNPSPTPDAAPHLKHIELKQYMLELINAEREQVGVAPVVLGQNNAAQLHADASLAGCFNSHWDLNGLNPWMRYHRAGGYQWLAENTVGLNFCITEAHGYAEIRDVRLRTLNAMNALLDSPSHRGTIIHPWARKVNVGIAWDRYNHVAYQQFEGDYVEYTQLPSIEDGVLSFSGRANNPVRFKNEGDLGVFIGYHQPTRPLTRGQITMVYSYGTETPIAVLRWPLKPGWGYPDDGFTYTWNFDLDPYDLPADSPVEQYMGHDRSYFLKELGLELATKKRFTIPWVTAHEWVAKDDTFHVKVDIRDLLAEYGDGVYRVVVQGAVNDRERPEISSYSIFVGE